MQPLWEAERIKRYTHTHTQTPSSSLRSYHEVQIKTEGMRHAWLSISREGVAPSVIILAVLQSGLISCQNCGDQHPLCWHQGPSPFSSPSLRFLGNSNSLESIVSVTPQLKGGTLVSLFRVSQFLSGWLQTRSFLVPLEPATFISMARPLLWQYPPSGVLSLGTKNSFPFSNLHPNITSQQRLV